MKLKDALREDYSRANRKQIEVELYAAKELLNSLYSRLHNGNDFHVEDLNHIIKNLEKLRSTVQKFDDGTMPIDKNYR